MLNINENLLNLQSEIGTDAFCVLLQIARHSNSILNARPGLFKLSQLTGLSQRKVSQATNKLQKMGFISKKQLFVTQDLQTRYPKLKNKKIGSFFSNQYTITTSFISKFVTAKNSKFYDCNPEEFDDSQFNDIVNDDVVTDDVVKPTDKVLKDKEVLKDIEVLKEVGENTHDFENQKQNILNNPLFGMNQKTKFPDLTLDEIDLEFLNAWEKYKNLGGLHANLMFSWLQNQNRQKQRNSLKSKQLPQKNFVYEQNSCNDITFDPADGMPF
jgi:hypothetical protein